MISPVKLESVDRKKSKIRKKIIHLRRSFDKEDLKKKSRQVGEHLYGFREYEKAEHVLFYLSSTREVETDEMIRKSLQLGKKVYVPLVAKKKYQLEITELAGMEIDFELNRFGIREPRKEFLKITSPEVVDFLIIPGLAFDSQGGRIGHGIGYFDRFLKQVPNGARRVALAFDFQVMDSVPQEDFDVPVQNIITETTTINC